MLGASVGVAVTDARGLSDDDLEAVVTGVVASLDARTGRAVRDKGPACSGDRACIDAVRARTATRDVVTLRLIGVPTRVRVLASRNGEAPHTVDVDRAQEGWGAAWSGLAEALFPAPPPVAPPPVASVPPPSIPPPQVAPPVIVTPPPEGASPSVAPWIIAGAGVAALAVGVGFGLSSRGARATAANEPASPRELDDLESRAQTHGVIANVAFGSAFVAGVAAVAWVVFE